MQLLIINVGLPTNKATLSKINGIEEALQKTAFLHFQTDLQCYHLQVTICPVIILMIAVLQMNEPVLVCQCVFLFGHSL